MGTEITKDQWYANWFDTPFYHILYKDRDHQEAADFMQRLTQSLNLSTDAHILDLACGRGRHSMYLNKLGYKVTGVDLSENSIAFAKAELHKTTSSTPGLKTTLLNIDQSRIDFKVHDMTGPLDQTFDAVFNLFTSFGYFEKEEDNLKTIKAIEKELKPNACAVIDFMNVPYVVNNLVQQDSKTEQGITFHNTRKYEGGFITKDIEFTHDSQEFEFKEKVRALKLADFQSYYNQTKLNMIEIYGNYDLDPYHPENSERLIMVVRKNS